MILYYVMFNRDKAITWAVNTILIDHMYEPEINWFQMREKYLHQLDVACGGRMSYGGRWISQIDNPCFVYGPFDTPQEANAFPQSEITPEALVDRIAPMWKKAEAAQ